MSTDELTGVQALERKHAGLPLAPGKVERREFEYIRHGTRSFIISRDVVTGQIVEPYGGPRRTEADFLQHVEAVIASDRVAQRWHFVVDNLDTHRSESLVRWVARESGLDLELGKKGKCFRTDFMYYYFLGKFLAGNSRLGLPVINEMCINSHREANYLTLLFAIHHTTDNSIIEDLLLRTMDTLGSVSPATLERDETRRFGEVITQLPEDVMSSKGVQQARTEERQRRDVIEEQQAKIRDNGDEEPASADERLIDSESVNGIYKILKNNKIMGQVLRNRHGNLDKSTIEEIIQTIADSGLRLVNSVLANEQDIARLASYISQKHSDWDAEKLKEALRFLSFAWTMVNIEQVVEAFNIPEIREAIDSVVKKNATPAYDLIGYFSQLDSATQITSRERASLESLLKKHDDLFVQRVLSIRTQFYMNTHRSRTPIEQAICSLLEIRYRPRLLPFS